MSLSTQLTQAEAAATQGFFQSLAADRFQRIWGCLSCTPREPEAKVDIRPSSLSQQESIASE